MANRDELERFELPFSKVIPLMQAGFEEYARGKLVDTIVPLQKNDREPKIHLVIQTKAHERNGPFSIHKRIDEYWEPDEETDEMKKTGRDTIILIKKDGKTVKEYAGDALTNARTGAAAALMAHHLTPKIDKLAIIGASQVGANAALAAYELCKPKEIHFGSGSDSEARIKAWLPDVTSAIKGHVIYDANGFSKGMYDLVENADAVIIANAMRHPLTMDLVKTMQPHVHISAMSGDASQHNLSDEVMRSAAIITDSLERALETAELRHYKKGNAYRGLNIQGTVGDAACGSLKDEKHALSVYDASGMGVSDLILARAIA